MFKKWSCVSTLAACLFVQGLSAGSIFVTSPDPGITTLGLFTTEPLLFAGTVAGPAGSSQVLAGPGNRYYVTGGVAADGVLVLEGSFPSLTIRKRIPLPSVPTTAMLSPDGRRLVVSHPGGVQIIDTTTETALTGTTGLNVGSTAPSIAISTDGLRVFVAAQAQRRVYVVNLESGTTASEIVIAGEPAALSVGPNGLLYVSVQNAIYEYHPVTFDLRATFSLNGRPGPISFTPDGKLGVAANGLPVGSKSAFILDLVRRTVTDIPASNGLSFRKLVGGDNASAFAISTDTNRLYYINLLSSGTEPSVYNASTGPIESVRDIAISNETPQARSLFVLTTTGSLYKVDIATNQVIGPLAASANGLLSFATTPITGTASTLLPINSSQTLTAGSQSLPLRVRAVNSDGVPLSGVPVTFGTEATGATLSNASATTDIFGYAQTTVNISASTFAGVVTVTASASGQSTTFSLNVTGTDPGPGPGPEPSTGGLRIVSGQGQVTSRGYPTNRLLTVQVVDATGNPVPNVPLIWSVSQGGGALGSASPVTDENGIGTASFSNFFVQLGLGYATSQVSVNAAGETVNFVVTTVPDLPNGGRGEAQIFLRQPAASSLIVARAGETLPAAIEAIVGSLLGGGIPNVGIRLETASGGPTATCRDGVPLSNSFGIVTCDLIAGPVLGETLLRAYIGETAIFTFVYRVEPGQASALRILAGNNQTGSTGQTLTSNLSVQVTDAGGNPLRNVVVTWEAVPAGSATFAPATSTTEESGRASTRVTLGQQPGLVQVRASAGTGSVTFSLTSQAAASRLEVTGGANQAVGAGLAFPNPIAVTLFNAQNQPISGATVQFLLTSGSATVPTSAVTNTNGVASVNVTAGAVPGPVAIRASYGSLAQTINLTVNAPGPVFTAASFVSAAGYRPGIAPGGIAVIYASGIAPDIRGSVTPTNIVGPLPTSLAGVEVLFNNVLAPIYSVSNINGQESVIVQVPFETAPGNASVTIRVSGAGSSTVNNVAVNAVKPAFFEFIDTNSSLYVVALRPDGSYVTAANPARRGENVRVFATGLGQTTPMASTNRGGVRDQNVSALVIAGINNEGVRLVSAKMVEGSVGVYVVEMEIPANAVAGISRPIAIAVAGSDGTLVYAGGAIAIQ